MAERLAEAKAQLETRHYEPALAAFDAVLAIDPGHVDARGLKAEILLNTARLDEAAEILVDLREELGSHTGVTWLLAMVRKDQGRFAEALELFDALPEARRPRAAVAEALSGLGRHDDAADQVAASLVDDPWNSADYYVLSTIETRRGREREARLWGEHHRGQEAERVAERKARGFEYAGQAVAAKLARAEAQSLRGSWSEAVKNLQEILQADPRAASAYSTLGRIQSDLGQAAAAVGALEQAVALQPADGILRQLLAQERALAQNPATARRTPLEMARYHAAVGDLEKARAVAIYAVRLNPGDLATLRFVETVFDREPDAFVRLWAWRQALGIAPRDAGLRSAWEKLTAKLGLRLTAPSAGS
ncbi:MAG: tetratricopeptide repeat protein [Planctomycetes bacterium]|nr:tetratricopeptide repeat protein [Planctomycetota bacterium]